jgi:hypothetical protein
MTDSTSANCVLQTQFLYVHVEAQDYYRRAIQVINEACLKKIKGSLTFHFDGSGRIARITKTEDIK